MQESLSQDQLRQAIEIMQGYLIAPSSTEGRVRVEDDAELGRQRVVVIKMILSSKPSKRVCPFLTSCGSKLESRSRGTSIRTWPRLPLIVFADLPLRELPEF